MVIRLRDYRHGHRIVSLAKCEDTLGHLKEENLDTIYLCGGRLMLLPENVVLSTAPETMEAFSQCDDYDVFEIDDRGTAYLYYNNESTDNAFVVTGKCNSNCLMCPSSEGSRRAASTARVDDLLQIINHIPSDAAHLTITGGEPFLLGKDIFRFFEALRNKFTQTGFLLLTNGRIFSIPEYCDLLRQTLPPQTILGIPIHGHNAAVHDGITQAEGSFQQTFIGLKHLLAQGFRIELRIVVSRMTADFVDKIADLIAAEFPGVETVKIIGLEMLGNAAKNQDQVWMPYPAAFQKSKAAIMTLVSAGVDVELYNFPLCAVDKEFWPICAKSISDYKVRFAERCNSCELKDACGGIFAGTYRLAKDDVRPIGEQNAELFPFQRAEWPVSSYK